jgi:hypothetical protein
MLKWLLTWHVLYTVNTIYRRSLYTGGLIQGRSFVLVINKSDHVRHKQVSHKQENKHVLSSDYRAYINLGDLYSGGLYSGGLIFGGGGLIFGMR